MTAAYQARLRKAATAFVVALIHAAAIRVLLIVHDILIPSAAEQPGPAMTWVFLPPEPASSGSPNFRAAASATNFVVTPLAGDDAGAGLVTIPVSLVPPSPPAFVLPRLAPLVDPNAHVFAGIGDYFACDFANWDRLDDEQRKRCALNLSNLGSVAPLPFDYVDGKSTPFSLFGAHGTFAITPPTQKPFDLLARTIGCGWERSLCRLQPDKSGLDPDDQKRLTAAAHFELGSGWTLDAGAQGWMQSYIGGAHFVLTSGAVLTYRW